MAALRSLLVRAAAGLLLAVLVAEAQAQSAAPTGDSLELAFTEDLPFPGPATLEQFERLATERSPVLASASAVLQAARCEALQAGLKPNPSLGYLGTEMGNDGRAGQQGMLLKQTWVRGGKLSLSRAVALRRAEILEIQYERQFLRVLTDARIAFYRLLVAQRRVVVAAQLATTSQQAMETAERLLQALEGRRSDVLQAQIEYERSQVDVRRAVAQQQAAWRELLAAAGYHSLPLVEAEGDLGLPPELQWETALQRLVTESPEIRAAELDIQRADTFLRRQCAEQVPDLDASVAVQYDNATRDAYASIELSMPLRVHNRNQGNIGAARAGVGQAQAERQRIALDLQRRLAAEFQRYNAARFEVQRYQQEILPKAEETLRLVDQGYQAGEATFVELLTAQRTFFQVNLSMLDGVQQLWASYLRIEGLLTSDPATE